MQRIRHATLSGRSVLSPGTVETGPERHSSGVSAGVCGCRVPSVKAPPVCPARASVAQVCRSQNSVVSYRHRVAGDDLTRPVRPSLRPPCSRPLCIVGGRQGRPSPLHPRTVKAAAELIIMLEPARSRHHLIGMTFVKRSQAAPQPPAALDSSQTRPTSPADIGEYRPTGRCWPGCRCRTRAPPWPVWPVQSGFLPAAGVELELEVLDGTRGGEDVAVPEDLFETFQALADLAGEVASRRAAVHHCRVVRAGPWPWCSSRSGGLGRRRAPNRVPSTIVC